MTKVRLKYPLRIGKDLVPAGAVGIVFSEPTPRIAEKFPGLKTMPDGQMLLVKFGELSECLVFKKQVEVINEIN
jgi:hypothetical protein